MYLWQRLQIVVKWPKLLPHVMNQAFLYEKERFGCDSDESLKLDSDHEREDLLEYSTD